MPDAFEISTLKRKNAKGLLLPPSSGKERLQSRQADLLSSRQTAIRTQLCDNLLSKDVVLLSQIDKKSYLINMVQHPGNGKKFVQKVYRMGVLTSEQRGDFKQVLNIIRFCESDHLVKLFGSEVDYVHYELRFCMEFMEAGSPAQILRRSGPIPIDVLGKAVETTLEALVYLYEEHRIIHREVMPANIFLNSDGKIKLRGLHNCKMVDNSIEESHVPGSPIPYYSPEQVQGMVYTVKVDTWSLGVTIFELATGDLPFTCDEGGIIGMFLSIANGPSPELPVTDAIPSSLRQLVGKCLTQDPAHRPRPNELLERVTFIKASQLTQVNLKEWTTRFLAEEMGLAEDNPRGQAEAAERQFSKAKLQPTNRISTIPAIQSFLIRLDELISLSGKSNTLCPRCESVVDSDLTPSGHDQTVVQETFDVTRGSEACSLCQMYQDCVPSASLLEVSELPTALRKNERPANLEIGHLSDLMAEVLSLGRGVADRHTGSECAFQMAAAWIRTCITCHSTCGTLEPSPLPTRVIDVGLPDGSRSPSLYHSRSNEEGLYFTLTYRWGDDETVEYQTTRTRLQEYSNRIPETTLPQTIRDAIDITRRLGIRYLWVDSLCIIQDSMEDWAHEAQRMAEVYKNSLLTVAASADRKGYWQGCFRSRDRQQVRPIICPGRWQNGSTKYIFADRRRTHDGARPRTLLETRGWVLQEQILSRRILYYTEQELFWDCISATTSESFPDGIPSFYDTELASLDLRMFKAIVLAPGRCVAQAEIYPLWRKLIEEYSARSLTKETDKLVALLGLATEVSIPLGDNFVAGMWKSSIPHDLLWWVKDPARTQRPENTLAPSWSWAALNAHISYGFPGREEITQICIDIIQLVEGDQDATTSGSDDRIVVRGRLVPLVSDQYSRPRARNILPVWREDFHGIKATEVTCLIVALSENFVAGIGLQKCAASQDGDEYKRIGMVYWRSDSENFGMDTTTWTWMEGVKLETIVLT